MRNRIVLAFGLVVLVICASLAIRSARQHHARDAGQQSAGLSEAARSKIAASYGQLPLSFEKNTGQTDSKVSFLARGRGGAIFVTPTSGVFTLAGEDRREPRHHGVPAAKEKPRREGAFFKMNVVGANPSAEPIGLEELPGKVNYFIGTDQDKWRTNIPTFAKVKVPGVYSGIDLVWYGNQGQLEYDFVVAPGADPDSIRVAFEGVDRLRVDADGNLILTVAGREVVQRRPLVYEEENGKRRELGAAYVVLGQDEVAFRVEGRDPRRTLVIDPALVYSTYLGALLGTAALASPWTAPATPM